MNSSENAYIVPELREPGLEQLAHSSSSEATAIENQFSQEWQHATVQPESASLKHLWQVIEPYLDQLSDTEQLHLVGYVISQLAELHSLKADRLLADWQDHHSDDGPVMDLDWLQGLVQRSMHLDLESLIRPKIKKRRVSPHQSVVGTVDKKKILQMVEAIEIEEAIVQNPLNVAYDENVSGWIQQIQACLADSDKPKVSLLELVKVTKLPLVKVWLALLLSGCQLEQQQEFYSIEGIWVHSAIPK